MASSSSSSSSFFTSTSMTHLPPPPDYSPPVVTNASQRSPFLPSVPSLPPSPSTSPSDAMVAAFPLEDVLPTKSGEPSKGSRHLPHLISAALSLSLTKPSIHVVLSEPVVFITPPKVDEFGLTPRDYGIQGSEDDGKDGNLSGFVNVVSPQRRFVQGIRLELQGRHRLVFPDTYWEDDIFLKKSLLVGGSKGLWLEKGVNTWEFCITIPSSSPVYDLTSSGFTKYALTATVLGSGSYLRGDLTQTKNVMTACKPDRETTILHVNQQSLSDHFGPFAFELSSNEFLVGGGLTSSITLAAPPPTLTIFAVNVYLQQTTKITSPKNPTRTSEVKGPRRWIVRQGEKDGYAETGFAEKARKKGTVIFEGSKVGKTGGLKEGEMWKWNRFGRLPTDRQIRPTTIPGTLSPFKFSSELVVEVVFNEATDATVKIATLFRQPVYLASCACTLSALNLPNYGSEEISPNLKADGSAFCMCDEKFEKLEEDAIALMRNGGRELDGEFITERRRGGSLDELLGESDSGREQSRGTGGGEGLGFVPYSAGCAEEVAEEQQLGSGMVMVDGRVRKIGEIC